MFNLPSAESNKPASPLFARDVGFDVAISAGGASSVRGSLHWFQKKIC